MVRKWVPMGLAVGLLAAAISGTVLASGGGSAEGGEGNTEEVVVKDGDVSVQSIGNPDVESGEPEELTVRIAEILGTDPQATRDAMDQAAQVDLGGTLDDSHAGAGDADSMSVDAEGMSYLEYGERIGAILGVDGESVARAIAQANEEMYGVERDIRDNGSGRDAEGKYDAEKHPAGPDADG